MAKRLRRRTLRRKSIKHKKRTLRRKSFKNKKRTLRRKSVKKKTMKGGFFEQCGNQFANIEKEESRSDADNEEEEGQWPYITNVENVGRTHTKYDIRMVLPKHIPSMKSGATEKVIEIKGIKLREIKKLRDRIGKVPALTEFFRSPVVKAKFDEFPIGTRNNCEKRFTQINKFFDKITEALLDGSDEHTCSQSGEYCLVRDEERAFIKTLCRMIPNKWKVFYTKPYKVGRGGVLRSPMHAVEYGMKYSERNCEGHLKHDEWSYKNGEKLARCETPSWIPDLEEWTLEYKR